MIVRGFKNNHMKKDIILIIDDLKNIFRYAMFNYKGSHTEEELNHFITKYDEKITVFLKNKHKYRRYIFLNDSLDIIKDYYIKKNYFELAKYVNILYHKIYEISGSSVKEEDFIVFNKDKDIIRVKNNHLITLVLDNIRAPFNVGAFFRIADAIGADKIYLCGITPLPDNNKVKRTAMKTDEYIDWQYEKYTSELIMRLKKDSNKIISVETTSKSIGYNSINYNQFDKTVFIFGNEEFGIEYPVLRMSDYIVSIPMYGKKNSLNVSVSAGIILYNYLFLIHNPG